MSNVCVCVLSLTDAALKPTLKTNVSLAIEVVVFLAHLQKNKYVWRVRLTLAISNFMCCINTVQKCSQACGLNSILLFLKDPSILASETCYLILFGRKVQSNVNVTESQPFAVLLPPRFVLFFVRMCTNNIKQKVLAVEIGWWWSHFSPQAFPLLLSSFLSLICPCFTTPTYCSLVCSSFSGSAVFCIYSALSNLFCVTPPLSGSESTFCSRC